MTEHSEIRRPTTPKWLRDFTLDLFDFRCLICQTDRPLDVAHLEDWREISEQVGNDPDEGFWEFHQPANVVVLCANHHRLLDDRHELSVTIEIVTELREALFDQPGVGDKIRTLLCQLIANDVGKRRMRGVFIADTNRLFPLIIWLRGAAIRGVLSEPHDFAVLRESGHLSSVSLKDASISTGSLLLEVPVWREGRFIFSSDAV